MPGSLAKSFKYTLHGQVNPGRMNATNNCYVWPDKLSKYHLM